MKKILYAVLGLALIGGGGYGLMTTLNKPAQASEAKEEKKTEEAAKSGEEGGAEASGPIFVEMKPLVLPIVDANGVSQTVSFVVSLEAATPEVKAEIEKMTPRLVDAYLQDMYGSLSRKAAMNDGLVQVGFIKERLTNVTAEVLGKDKVKNVLLQAVQQSPV